jgi:ADP-ribosylglycohydrolase
VYEKYASARSLYPLMDTPPAKSLPDITPDIVGCLLGTAVGDAIGLPAEGLSRNRQRRLFGEIDGHRLLFGRGLVSDDTEHAVMVARALIASAGDPNLFASHLARQLKAWLLLLPAGVGLATLRASIRLLFGVPPSRSGVFSAGNGPAMRAPLLGVCYGNDLDHLRALVRVSTRLTHIDPKAEHGALAVALAAYHAGDGDPDPHRYLGALKESLRAEDADELLDLARRAVESVEADETTTRFAEWIGLRGRVTGYVNHTVPVALHAWLRHPNDFRAAVLSVIACGGDTDTTAAIVGGIIGASVGKEGIPQAWIDGLERWPHDTGWLESLATRLTLVIQTGRATAPPPVNQLALAPRNLLFLAVVLYHGLRRLLPPY